MSQSSFVMRGDGAELRAGYNVAARLGAWTLRTDSTDGSVQVEAAVRERDLFWMEREPDVLVLQVREKRWRFRGVTVADGNPIRLSGNGSPEIRGG